MAAYKYAEHNISFRSALMLAAGIVLISATFSFLLGSEQRIMANDLITILVDLLAALGLFWAAHSSDISRRHVVLAWTAMTLGQVTHTIGDVLWIYTEIGLHQAPFPSLADGWFLAQYLFFAIGILLLPRISLIGSEKLKVLLDTGVVMIASVMLFWVLLIAPILKSNTGADTYTMTLSLAYPVLDLMLLFALIELLFRRIESVQPGPILLLAFGTALMIGTDFLAFGQALQNTYLSGSLLDTGWIAAYSCFGLAGVLHANFRELDSAYRGLDLETGNAPGNTQFSWPHYLPFIWAGAAYILLLWSHDHALPLSFSYLSWGVGGIIALIIIRQIVALKENHSLYLDAKKAEEEIRRLNQDLEGRVADRTAQLEAANEDLNREVVERKMAEEKIAASLQEKEVLLREIHHRVKNNLQVISSLLSLQSGQIADKQAQEVFKESQNRIKSMAKIHETLYKSGDLARIDFAEYAKSLTGDLFSSYRSMSNTVALKVNIRDVMLHIDTAIPCGLIINELVSNSIRHAFPCGRKGEVHIDP